MRTVSVLCVGLVLILVAFPVAADHDSGSQTNSIINADLPWWGWASMLFGFTVVLGVVAVLAGVGGGVLFVPIVGALFPFHFDFVRGAGLMVALCGAISAGPRLLRSGMASMRLGVPLALCLAIGSTLGAVVGLALPTGIVQGLLGVAIVGIVVLMLMSRESEHPEVTSRDALSVALGIEGSYEDESLQRTVEWKVHRLPIALLSFLFIGLLAGMFGLGAGWANVPALNLMLGAPVKVAVATSGFVLALNPAAAWVYLNGGAVLPLIAAPSVAGMMIGTRVGARLLPKIRAKAIRWLVISVLLVSGIRSLLAGFVGV